MVHEYKYYQTWDPFPNQPQKYPGLRGVGHLVQRVLMFTKMNIILYIFHPTLRIRLKLLNRRRRLYDFDSRHLHICVGLCRTHRGLLVSLLLLLPIGRLCTSTTQGPV
jgi:hypothetical protein